MRMNCLCFVLLCFKMFLLSVVVVFYSLNGTAWSYCSISPHYYRSMQFTEEIGYRPEIPSRDLVSGYQSDTY